MESLRCNVENNKILVKVKGTRNHYTAQRIVDYERNEVRITSHVKPDERDTFAERLFAQACDLNIVIFSKNLEKNVKVVEYMLYHFDNSEYADCPDNFTYINNFIRLRLNRTFQRLKRVYTKINFHTGSKGRYFNYFYTQSMNPNLFASEAEFKRKFECTMNHYALRRGWRGFFCYENAPDTGALHVHACFHIPEGQLPGGTVKKSSPIKNNWSKRKYRDENDFFLKRFGINDFRKIESGDLNASSEIVQYITKYILKTGNKLHYSRGLADCIEAYINPEKDSFMEFSDYNTLKLLLWSTTSIYADYMNRFADYIVNKKELAKISYLNRLKLLVA